MQATRNLNTVEYIIYNGDNIKEVEEFLNGKCSFNTVHNILWDSIEQATEVFRDSINNHSLSHILSEKSEWFNTKEGEVLLFATIKSHKTCHYVENIKITVKETKPFKEPLPELYVKGSFVPLGFYIVYEPLVGTLVLSKETFFTHFD